MLPKRILPDPPGQPKVPSTENLGVPGAFLPTAFLEPSILKEHSIAPI